MKDDARGSSLRKRGPGDARAGSWRIRSARPSDLEELTRIEAKSYASPWSPEGFAVLGANESVRILVAEDRGEGRAMPLGFAVFWIAGGEAELANLAVDPSVRRRGLGGELLDRAIAVARESGVTAFYLDVRAGNRAAIELYRARGFRHVSTRTQYYQHPSEDAKVMRLDLSPGTEP